MDAPPTVSPDVLAALPAEVLALIQWQARQIERLTARVAQLEAEVAALKARLNKNSANSSLPPSAMHPHAKPSKQSIRKAKRRGGQPGHEKHERALIPAGECQAVVVLVQPELDFSVWSVSE